MDPLQVVWRYGSTAPENPQHFDTIAQWWGSLAGKTITWRQRLAEGDREVRELDWEAERFDESFEIIEPTVRGITFYFQKPGSNQERSTTPARLELDTLQQQLFIYPQSQPDLVVRVGLPEIKYQTLDLSNPEIEVSLGGGHCTLLLTDRAQALAVNVTLNAETLYQLKKQLP